MPRALAQYLRALFGQKENFNVYFSGKGDCYYIQTRHNNLFFSLQSFSRKTLRKIRVLFDKFVTVDDKARTMIERSN